MGGALLKGWLARGIGPVTVVEPNPSASLKALEKKYQGSIPAHTMMEYGTLLCVCRFAILLNRNVNTTMVMKGRRMLHRIPIAVCLYRTRISRQAKK